MKVNRVKYTVLVVNKRDYFMIACKLLISKNVTELQCDCQ